MEDETITPSPEYVKGFNEGYLMAEHLPDIADKLARVKNNSERLSGFKDGKSQHFLEKFNEQHRSHDKPKERDRE